MRKPAVSPALFLAFVLLAAILILAGSVLKVRAHSFYPWECCHDRDCWMTGARDDGQPMREADPVFTRDGWLLSDGTLVPFTDARPSPDGRFHVCRQGGADKGSVIRPSGAPVCLWVPQGAS